MKKIITIYLLLVTLIAGGMTANAQNKINRKKSNTKTNTTQTSKYNSNKGLSKKDQMLSMLKKYNTDPDNMYFVTDLNQDGLPELWIFDEKNADKRGMGGSTLRVFSFVNGNLVQDSMNPAGWGCEPFMIGNKLYLYEGIQTWKQVENISLENGKIRQTLMYEGTMNDDGEVEVTRGSKQNKKFIDDNLDDREIKQSPLKNSSLLLKYF